MSKTANELAAAQARLEQIRVDHAEVGKKYMGYRATLDKEIEAKLIREKYAPFLRLQDAQKRTQKRQQELVAEATQLERQTIPALLGKLSAEFKSQTQKKDALEQEPLSSGADSVENAPEPSAEEPVTADDFEL